MNKTPRTRVVQGELLPPTPGQVVPQSSYIPTRRLQYRDAVPVLDKAINLTGSGLILFVLGLGIITLMAFFIFGVTAFFSNSKPQNSFTPNSYTLPTTPVRRQ